MAIALATSPTRRALFEAASLFCEGPLAQPASTKTDTYSIFFISSPGDVKTNLWPTDLHLSFSNKFDKTNGNPKNEPNSNKSKLDDAHQNMDEREKYYKKFSNLCLPLQRLHLKIDLAITK
jgi:hypothetical protein